MQLLDEFLQRERAVSAETRHEARREARREAVRGARRGVRRLLFGAGTPSRSAASPWSAIDGLASCNDTCFHATVVPLSLMDRLTYTATFGSYYNESERNATVAGWTRDVALTANPPAGMRALLFVQPSTQRAVVAFRGTDLNTSGVSGQADACADAIFASASKVPEFCGQFDNHTLDYLPRAMEFAARASRAYPNAELLFTGHSLGASLAMMVAALLQSQHGAQQPPPAVVFSAGAWREALHRRTGFWANTSSTTSRLYSLADRWDPVQASAVAADGLLGDACLWDTGRAYPGCRVCWVAGGGHAPPAQWESDPACQLCFRQAHVYSHYVYHLVPGPRPLCAPVADDA